MTRRRRGADSNIKDAMFGVWCLHDWASRKRTTQTKPNLEISTVHTTSLLIRCLKPSDPPDPQLCGQDKTSLRRDMEPVSLLSRRSYRIPARPVRKTRAAGMGNVRVAGNNIT